MIIQTSARLVDQDQNDPPQGPVHCYAEYTFSPENVALYLRCHSDVTAYMNDVRIVLPVISSSGEPVGIADDKNVHIQKSKAQLHIQSSEPLKKLPTTGDRIFNFVPGWRLFHLSLASQ